ncbi:MAG: AAA family ATPase [Hyphomonadaceae bacterium]|nr:AAA family ATPase [Hyphomonadaceae bacterium]
MQTAAGANQEVGNRCVYDGNSGEERLVGYLFTDIDGSTEKWERTPGEMRAALARHDALIDEIVARNGGAIRDHAGDGVFAVFPAGNPLQCAIDIQLSLQAQDWREIGGLTVRVGIHCSAVPVADDIDRAQVNRAARIMASAWGGQIVLSSVAVGAYPTPIGCQLTELGLCRFKGIDEPLRLLGLLHPTFQQVEFPPLRALAGDSHTAFVQVNPIYGRDQELADVIEKLSTDVRLLTVVGPGGNGKTRLAYEVAAGLSGRKVVYFVSLDDASTSSEAVVALAAALRFPLHRRASQEEQILEYLRGKDCLIIFDQIDRLVGDASFFARVLAACPRVRVLTTSREPLLLPGETVFRLFGLPLPGVDREALDSAPAVLLFAQTARAVDPGFRLHEGELEAFREICKTVSGSPLALHLLAQWSNLYSIPEILERLSEGLDFLSELESESRNLRKVFEGSWEILTREQREALSSLSVFRSGFDARAAQTVAATGPAILSVLERKCLLERRDRRRFVMHPLIHDYALARLPELRDATGVEQTFRRHCEYYLTLMRERYAAARGTQQGAVLDELQGEIANIGAAWRSAIEREDWGRVRECVEPLFYFFVLRSMFRECAALFEPAVAEPELQRYFLAIRANCTIHQGDYTTSEDLARRALDGGAANPITVAHCYQALGNIAHARGELAIARLHYERALSERVGAGDQMGSYWSVMSLAWLNMLLPDVAQARHWVKEAYRLCQKIGHLGGALAVHMCAGDIAVSEGRDDDAHANYRKALSVEESVNHPQYRVATLMRVGALYLKQGRCEASIGAYEEALVIAEVIGDHRQVVNVLIGVAQNRRLVGDAEAAAIAAHRALSVGQDLGSKPVIAAALLEFARAQRDIGEANAAARAVGLARLLGDEAVQVEADALSAALPSVQMDHASEQQVEDAVIELINQREFGELTL